MCLIFACLVTDWRDHYTAYLQRPDLGLLQADITPVSV